MKKGRIVILTTHSMEEADLLSDRIAFLKNGELKCIGTSFELKDEFAEDFYISLILKKAEYFEEVVAFLAKQTPNLKIKSVFDRKMDFEVPKDDFGTILTIINSIVTSEEPMKSKIDDWGFSNSTLENVFEKLNQNN